MSFQTLNKKFSKELDLVSFTKAEQHSIKFLLVRSMDTEHIKCLAEKLNFALTGGKLTDLQEQIFNSDKITEKQIIKSIREQYPAVRTARLEAEQGLEALIQSFDNVNCGLRNDKVDDLVKSLVRDKELKTKVKLLAAIESKVVAKIRDYALWSFYNQVSNDLIEHAVNDHEKVIPTLRKIPGVDFFLEVGQQIIPFDLKITHISDDFFDLFSQGLTVATGQDNYKINENGLSETKVLKEMYKKHKSGLKLDSIGDAEKSELIERMSRHTSVKEIKDTLAKVKNTRECTIAAISQNLHSLEWWNFKYQGERLFKNNNRFFVFLAFKNKFEDARILKGRIKEIRQKIKSLLDGISSSRISKIKYFYEKEQQLNGAYEAQALSVILTE